LTLENEYAALWLIKRLNNSEEIDSLRITIKDVARESGCSVATVSLVLNGRGRVSEETRAKILKIAEVMNYRPNHLAVGLVTKKTHTIGLIVPDVSNFHSRA
jgi:LacI family transcriptional regulator